jgi:2-oxoglutarate ferredoxin oxidoreductase subunit beta
MTTEMVQLTRKDFQTPNDVRWCPGCGDYAILATVQRTLPDIGVKKEDIAVISGIGCSSRFPYYMNTYGMHSVHGRAPTVATGLKVTRPELSVWVITGDGDSMSIGGNHTMHVLRRNVDLNILMFNNQIYGLTKGQYSPTSVEGKVAKSTPFGSIDHPVNPAEFALGSGSTFFARAIDTDAKHLAAMLKRGHEHKGTAFIEILQNCNIFNDGTWEFVRETKARKQNALYLEDGKPLIYAGGTKGIALSKNGFSPEVVDLEKEPERKDDLIVHQEDEPTGMLAQIYAKMSYPNFPVPLGVFRTEQRPTYDGAVNAQTEEVVGKLGEGTIKDLLYAGDTWEVS